MKSLQLVMSLAGPDCRPGYPTIADTLVLLKRLAGQQAFPCTMQAVKSCICAMDGCTTDTPTGRLHYLRLITLHSMGYLNGDDNAITYTEVPRGN